MMRATLNANKFDINHTSSMFTQNYSAGAFLESVNNYNTANLNNDDAGNPNSDQGNFLNNNINNDNSSNSDNSNIYNTNKYESDDGVEMPLDAPRM